MSSFVMSLRRWKVALNAGQWTPHKNERKSDHKHTQYAKDQDHIFHLVYHQPSQYGTERDAENGQHTRKSQDASEQLIRRDGLQNTVKGHIKKANQPEHHPETEQINPVEPCRDQDQYTHAGEQYRAKQDHAVRETFLQEACREHKDDRSNSGSGEEQADLGIAGN